MEFGWARSAPHFIYTHHTSLTAPAPLLFAFCICFVSFSFCFHVDLDVVFGRHGICVDGGCARQVWRSRGECVKADGGFAQATSLVSDLADPQFTDVFAKIRRKATESRLYRHADWPLGDFAINRNTASRVLRDRLCHEVMTRLCIRSASLLRLPGFWLHTLPFERRAHGVTPIRSLC